MFFRSYWEVISPGLGTVREGCPGASKTLLEDGNIPGDRYVIAETDKAELWKFRWGQKGLSIIKPDGSIENYPLGGNIYRKASFIIRYQLLRKGQMDMMSSSFGSKCINSLIGIYMIMIYRDQNGDKRKASWEVNIEKNMTIRYTDTVEI